MNLKEVKYGDKRSVWRRERPTIYRPKWFYMTRLAGVLWVDRKKLPKQPYDRVACDGECRRVAGSEEFRMLYR